MADKTLSFKIDIEGVTTEQAELAKLEVSMKSLRAEKLKLIKESVKEGQTTKENQLRIAQLTAAINKNAAAQKQLKQAITPTQSSFVRLGKTLLATLGLAGGLTMAVRALFNVIKNGFKTSIQFEYAMSQVKAITRATSEDFEALRGNAISLGSATKFTATEVAGLQKEYAKLGFTTTEILRITKATLDLAAATGSDLAFAATIAGATLRQFSLDATQMQRVVDVMALSFSRSALDMNKFETAMSKAGPVAAAVGDTIEDTTAKLATLANSGLDASISGTSLRNIYLELEKRGLSWNDAMTRIQGSQSKATTSLELFGKRGAVAGLVLADNIELVNQLTTEFKDAAGSAEEMADVMLDNVQGSMTIMKSQWEGFILRVNESNAALQKTINLLSDFIKVSGTLGKKDYAALVDINEVKTFSDKLTVYSKLGIGKLGSYLAAILTTKEQTLEVAKGLSKEAREEIAIEEEKTKAKLKAGAEEKRINDEKLKRIQAEIDLAEKAAEKEKQAAKEREQAAEKELEAQEKAVEKELELQRKAVITKRDEREQAGVARMKDLQEKAAEEVRIEKEKNDALLEGEKALADSKFQIALSATNLINALAGKSKAIQKAALIAEKAVAIAEIITKARIANMATTAWGAAFAIPTAGASIITALAINAKNKIAEILNIGAVVAATAVGLAGFKKGGKINRGIPVNTGTVDNKLIAVNDTETVLTSKHVAMLGGSRTMKHIGVPGYAEGGYTGQQAPVIPPMGFDYERLARLIPKHIILDINKVRSSLDEVEIITTTQKI